MDKIRVCYLVSSLCNEGPVNVMYNIIRNLDFSLFEVSIVTLVPEKPTSRIADFQQLPVNIYQLFPDIFVNPVKLYFAMRKKLSTIKPNLVHAHCPRSLYLMNFLPKSYKHVYTIHIYPGAQAKALYGNVKGTIVNKLNHFFMRQCDLPIGCAENVSEQYLYYKGWHVINVPNGCSLPVWVYHEEERERLRHELGLKSNVRYFVFIGRFSPEKRPDFLYDVFQQLNNPSVGLIMLGSGPLWQTLHDRGAKNLVLPGFTTRVYDYLKAADFYISTSEVEGLSNAVLESMSVGLPMLLTPIPAHVEIMRNFQETTVGYYIDNNDENDVVDKVKKILTLDVIKASACIREIYQQKYTAQAMADGYMNAYRSIL